MVFSELPDMSDTSHDFLQQCQKKEQVTLIPHPVPLTCGKWLCLGGSEWQPKWELPIYTWIIRTEVRTIWIRTTRRWWKAELHVLTYWRLPPLSTSSYLHLFTSPPSTAGTSHHRFLTCALHKLTLTVATPCSGGPTQGKLPPTKFSAPQRWWPPQTSLRPCEQQIPALFNKKMTTPTPHYFLQKYC